MKKVTAVFAALMFAGGAALSGPVQDKPEPGALILTLDDCIRLALSQNPVYLAVRESVEGARYQMNGAAAQFFPSLNASGYHTLDEKLFVLEFPSFIPGEPPQRFSIDFTKDYQATLALSLPLFTGGRLTSGFKSAKYNYEATRESERQSRQETVFNVKSAFYGYLVAKEFAAVTQEAVSLAEKHLQNVKNLYDVGMASKFDLLRSEVQVANLKPQLIKARNGLKLAELGLKSVIGLDLEKPVLIQGQMAFAPYQADPEECQARALANRPELLQFNYQERMAGEMLKMARASFLPTLAISGQYNYWGDQLNFRKGTWQSYFSVNLVFSLPIFNGLAAQAEIGRAQSAIKAIEFSRKGMTDMINLEVQQALLNLNQARESLLSQEKNVEQAQEAVRIAELNYAEGLATNLDVSSAQVALTQAKTNYTQALFDYVMSIAQLDKATGVGAPATGEGDR